MMLLSEAVVGLDYTSLFTATPPLREASKPAQRWDGRLRRFSTAERKGQVTHGDLSGAGTAGGSRSLLFPRRQAVFLFVFFFTAGFDVGKTGQRCSAAPTSDLRAPEPQSC